MLKILTLKLSLFATLVFSATALTTGIIPANIAGIETQSKANAESAWWGDYWRVDGNTAQNIAYQLNQGTVSYAFGAANIAWLFPPSVLWTGFQTANLTQTANTLNECARINNAAYFKVYSSRIWISRYGNVKIPYAVGASCN